MSVLGEEVSEYQVFGSIDLANLSSCKENNQEIQEKGAHKISASDQMFNMKSDCFTVEMEPFSHLMTNKDLTFNSRPNLLKSPSRKGSQKGAEKKTNCLTTDRDRDAIPSPKASSTAGTMPEKLLPRQPTNNVTDPQVHHQITIMTGATTTTKPAGTPTKSNPVWKRSTSFKLINPKRILFFFATLSSMGTILLIYLTLSMANYNQDGNSHTQT